MLFCKPLQKTTKAKDVFEAVSSFFDHILIKWENLVRSAQMELLKCLDHKADLLPE